MTCSRRAWVIAALGGAATPLTSVFVAFAANAGSPDAAAEKAPGWIVTIGAYGGIEPRSTGSKTYGPGWHPIFTFREAGGREWLELPNDSFDFAIIETDNFRAGPVVNLRLGANRAVFDRGFKRVGSVNAALDTGGFAELWPLHWLRTRVELRTGVIGASGLVLDTSVDFVTRPDALRTFAWGPRFSVADAAYMKSYYGIDPQQAMISGLPLYAPHGGAISTGAGASAAYKWSQDWTVRSFIEWQHLLGPAASSPLIDARGQVDQITVGVGLSYSFRVDW
jgi:outer membrane protein